MIPLLLALTECGRGEIGHWLVTVSQSLKNLAKNPVILSLVAGLLVSLMRWILPEPLATPSTCLPSPARRVESLSLFVIGGTLVGLPLHGMGRQVAPIVFAKLTLHPLAVFLTRWPCRCWAWRRWSRL